MSSPWVPLSGPPDALPAARGHQAVGALRGHQAEGALFARKKNAETKIAISLASEGGGVAGCIKGAAPAARRACCTWRRSHYSIIHMAWGSNVKDAPRMSSPHGFPSNETEMTSLGQTNPGGKRIRRDGKRDFSQ